MFSSQLEVGFGITRLITSIVMHILIQPEFEQSLMIMKYSINHSWKFQSYTLAFMTGFLQLSISCVIELANIYVMMFESTSQFDIIGNFVVMLVVADFDTFFYAARSTDVITSLLQDERYSSIFTWETTTSYDASARIPENKLKKEVALLSFE